MKRLIAAAALSTCCFAGPALAEEFTLFVYETPADLALRSDPSPKGQAYWAAWGQFAEILQKSGAMRGGAPLQLPAQGKVSRTGGSATGAAGTVTSGNLQLGGYFKLEVANADAAAALAAQAPSVARGGAAELRATYPAPTMTH